MEGDRRMAVRHRVALLVTLLAAVTGVLGLTVVPHLPGSTAALDLPWIAWVAAFAVSEVLVVHVQLTRDSHSFSMTDLVFVAGLYLLGPGALIAALVTGVALVLVLRRRQLGLKLAFNAVQFALAACVGTIVFGMLARATAL